MSYFGDLLNRRPYTLSIPKEHRETVINLAQAHQGGDPDSNPFPRQIDFWSMAVLVAISKGLPPQDPKDKTSKLTKFVETRSVHLPDNVCDLLAIAAVCEFGPDSEDVQDPAKIIQLGNRLAAVGTPVIIGALNDPDLTKSALDKVLDLAISLINPKKKSK